MIYSNIPWYLLITYLCYVSRCTWSCFTIIKEARRRIRGWDSHSTTFCVVYVVEGDAQCILVLISELEFFSYSGFNHILILSLVRNLSLSNCLHF